MYNPDRDSEDIVVDVSIVVVSWNTRRLLLDCLDSIKRLNTDLTLEIVVVDNASTDGSAEAVAELHSDVELVVNSTNLGFSRANNIGIGAARGRFICIVNSDVLVPTDVFSPLVTHMQTNADIGMLGPRVLNADGTLQTSCYRLTNPFREIVIALGLDQIFRGTPLSTRYRLERWPLDRPANVEMLVGCFVLVRRDALERVGLLDERLFFYGEDMDWCMRFRDAGWKVVYFPMSSIVHLGGGSSDANPMAFIIEYQRARLNYWSIHYGRCGRAFGYVTLLLHHSVRLLGRAVLFVVRPGNTSNAGKLARSLSCIRWLLSRSTKPEEAVSSSEQART